MRHLSNWVFEGLVRLIGIETVTTNPHLLSVDANGNVAKIANSFASAPVYQLDNISNFNPVYIQLFNFVGNNSGSYKVKIDMQFADLYNGNYAFSASKTVEFSFTVHMYGIVYVHSEPVIHVTHSSGVMVKLLNNTFWEVKQNDIAIETFMDSNNRLQIKIISNLNTSAYSEANSSFKCRYTVDVKKFVWSTGEIIVD